MRFSFLFLIFSPLILFSQNVGIGTTEPSEKLEVNGIIFTSQGGIKFPDGTIQTTAYTPSSGMMQSGLSAIVIEFDTNLNPSIEGPAMDAEIQDGINISSLSEGVSLSVTIGPSGQGPEDVQMNEVAFSRKSDKNTANLRKLLFTKSIIPYIEVFTLKMYGEIYYIEQMTRYEDCIITSIQSATSDEPFESVSFAFTKACYRSYDRGTNGQQIRINDACYDIESNIANCTCN